MCILGLTALKRYEMFILGNVFLQEYYSIWDMDNDRIGFSPSIYSHVPTLIRGQIETIKTFDKDPEDTVIQNLGLLANIYALFPKFLDPLFPLFIQNTLFVLVLVLGIPLCIIGFCCKMAPFIFTPAKTA
jgi:hypothetical protein